MSHDPPSRPRAPSPPELADLGANVRRIRVAQAMTQERLAELVDLNLRTVQKIEAGRLNILVTTVLRLQKALGCPWDQLLPVAPSPAVRKKKTVPGKKPTKSLRRV